MTGYEIAKQMLKDNNLYRQVLFVSDEKYIGRYDMKTQRLYLNKETWHGEDAKAISVAIHECGHAIQHKIFYWPLMIDIITMRLFGFRWFASKIESDASKRGLKWFESKVKCSTIFIDEVQLYLVSQLNLVIEPII